MVRGTTCRLGVAFSSPSAGAVAAVLEDALLEEGTELADVVLGEVEVAVCVGSER